jgi:hypothetical protein
MVGAGYTPADLLDLDRYIDFLETGHNTAQDTMYEMQIPFEALDISRATLESQGIGGHADFYFRTVRNRLASG